MNRAIQADRHAKASGRKDRSDPILDSSDFERSRESTPEPARPQPPRGEPVLGDAMPVSVNLTAEDWLLERLKDQGADPYAHAAVFGCMRDRLRTAIVNNGFARVIVGRHNGKPENYAQCFERLYGEPLVPTSHRSKDLATRETPNTHSTGESNNGR
jgi:hypothetical protein